MGTLKRVLPKRARWAVIRWRLRYGRWTSQSRALPDLLVIGAQKAGTTSLHYYLSQHPQLVPSFGKELHFFDGGLEPEIDNFELGLSWYRSFFPRVSSLGADKKVFETSPNYLLSPLAPKRIAEAIPGAKLVAILRDPTERAISNYFHERRRGREPLPLMQALQAEEERLESALQNRDYKSFEFIHYSYKSRGRYREQLERYLEYFPMEDILVLSSEAFFADPRTALQRVFAFAGVDPEAPIGDLRPLGMGSNKTKVEPEVYEYLQDYFRPHNQALYELVGEDFGW